MYLSIILVHHQPHHQPPISSKNTEWALFEHLQGFGPKKCSFRKKRLAHKGCSWRNSADRESEYRGFGGSESTIEEINSTEYLCHSSSSKQCCTSVHSSHPSMMYVSTPPSSQHLEEINLLIIEWVMYERVVRSQVVAAHLCPTGTAFQRSFYSLTLVECIHVLLVRRSDGT